MIQLCRLQVAPYLNKCLQNFRLVSFSIKDLLDDMEISPLNGYDGEYLNVTRYCIAVALMTKNYCICELEENSKQLVVIQICPYCTISNVP